MTDPLCMICTPSLCVHGEQSPTSEEVKVGLLQEQLAAVQKQANAWRANSDGWKERAEKAEAHEAKLSVAMVDAISGCLKAAELSRAVTAECDELLVRVSDLRKQRDGERDQWKRRVDESIGEWSTAIAAKVILELEVKNLKHALKELAVAAAGRVYASHNDTCGAVLSESEKYPCSCGHDALDAVTAKHIEAKP